MSTHTNLNVYISEVCTYGLLVAGGHGFVRKSGGLSISSLPITRYIITKNPRGYDIL